MERHVVCYTVITRSWKDSKIIVATTTTLKGARRIRDRKDIEYGASVHSIQENWSDGTVRHTL